MHATGILEKLDRVSLRVVSNLRIAKVIAAT